MRIPITKGENMERKFFEAFGIKRVNRFALEYCIDNWDYTSAKYLSESAFYMPHEVVKKAVKENNTIIDMTLKINNDRYYVYYSPITLNVAVLHTGYNTQWGRMRSGKIAVEYIDANVGDLILGIIIYARLGRELKPQINMPLMLPKKMKSIVPESLIKTLVPIESRPMLDGNITLQVNLLKRLCRVVKDGKAIYQIITNEDFRWSDFTIDYYDNNEDTCNMVTIPYAKKIADDILMEIPRVPIVVAIDLSVYSVSYLDVIKYAVDKLSDDDNVSISCTVSNYATIEKIDVMKAFFHNESFLEECYKEDNELKIISDPDKRRYMVNRYRRVHNLADKPKKMVNWYDILIDTKSDIAVKSDDIDKLTKLIACVLNNPDVVSNDKISSLSYDSYGSTYMQYRICSDYAKFKWYGYKCNAFLKFSIIRSESGELSPNIEYLMIPGHGKDGVIPKRIFAMMERKLKEYANIIPMLQDKDGVFSGYDDMF